MSDARMDLANPRHKRPNRLITNDAWAKPIIIQIAEDTGTPQQEVVRNVLRKGLRAMGYGNPPEDAASAEDEAPDSGAVNFNLCLSCRRDLGVALHAPGCDAA